MRILEPGRWSWQEKYENTLNIADLYYSVRPDSKIWVCTQRAWKRNLAIFELFFPFSFYWQQYILKIAVGVVGVVSTGDDVQYFKAEDKN